MPLLQGHIPDEEGRGMQPALLCLGLRRHSSGNALCKDLISVHNSKDAQKEFRIDLFPIKSTNRKRPDLLHPTQCSGTSHWIQPTVSSRSGLWAMVPSSMHAPLSNTEGLSQKVINRYKTGMRKNYARCARKSRAFLRSGGFLTTILVSLTLEDYLNHDLIHDLIAFHFLFLKIHWHETMFVKERKTNSITKWVLCPALMQISHMALGNKCHSFVLSLFVEQEC